MEDRNKFDVNEQNKDRSIGMPSSYREEDVVLLLKNMT